MAATSRLMWPGRNANTDIKSSTDIGLKNHSGRVGMVFFFPSLTSLPAKIDKYPSKIVLILVNSVIHGLNIFSVQVS